MTDHRTNSGAAAILFFLKAPRAGYVKTRLARSIGEAEALAAYRRLVERQSSELRGRYCTTVCYAPADAESELSEWLGQAFNYTPQCEGDLGRRLQEAVQDAFDQGARAVICIGGDCPGLCQAHVESAIAALDSGKDLVLGPTEDGGYYLIGLSASHAEIFDEIPWSQTSTLEATLQKAKSLKLDFDLLEELYDVDEVDDLERAAQDGLLSD